MNPQCDGGAPDAPGYETATLLGGNPHYSDDPSCGEFCPDPLGPHDPQCGSGYRIWDSNYSRLYWQWDYWVQGGYWVLWDGQIRGQWPNDFMLPGGQTGLISMRIQVINWARSAGTIHTRIFWLCSKLGQAGSAATGTSSTPVTPLQPVGVERTGGTGDDVLPGDAGRNALIGGAGDDRLQGKDGRDFLDAGAGKDVLSGGDHADQLYGRGGADKASGGNGADDILTGRGNDVAGGGRGGDQLFDNQGRDHLYGGPGNDRFSTRDGNRDWINCGPGKDIAIVDRHDVTTGCEYVFTARDQPKKLPKV
jgi:hypothetical protein